MQSEIKDDAVQPHTICITIESELKNGSIQAIAYIYLDEIVPKIVNIIADEIFTMFKAFEQSLDESTEGGEK